MEGLNGYSGEVIAAIFSKGNILKGNTYPVPVYMRYKDSGDPVNITGYEMEIVFDFSISCKDKNIDSFTKDIPVSDAAGGYFYADITEDAIETFPLGMAKVYIQYTMPNGSTFIYDYATIKVVE